MTKAIIFDFDGVICESVDIKTGAFRRLFEAYPEQLERILEYHVKNGGLSRYEKFRVIYRDFFNKDLSEKESQSLGQKFSQFSYEAVVRAPLVAGAYEFLQNNFKKFDFSIVSGTPETEMRSIVNEKKLGAFFKAVYGSPRSKETLIRLILKENRLKLEEAVFVGDSINDFDGAKAAGIGFIGRVALGENNPFIGFPLKGLVQDLNELEGFFKDEFEYTKRPEINKRFEP